MEKRLMTHIVAGYPTVDDCKKIVMAMAQAGVGYIEIQFPFSDPIADGPTIMRANEQVIANGMTTAKSFELVGRLRRKMTTPILIMTYYNVAFRYGLERFCRKARGCGVYGLIIPDIPIDAEQSERYLQYCETYGLHPIQVISPITPARRLKRIAEIASGFVYCVSTFGTTGARSALNPELRSYMKGVKNHITLPLALGFGISSKRQVQEALCSADIAVVGSKLIDIVDANRGGEASAVKKFLQALVT